MGVLTSMKLFVFGLFKLEIVDFRCSIVGARVI